MLLIQAAATAAPLLLAAVRGAMAQDRLGAMNDFSPDVMPRWYPDLMDPIAKRQNVVTCDPGTHSCLDVGNTTVCCPNDKYCFVDPSLEVRCCAIGLKCESECDPTKFRCNAVKVVTSGTTTSTSTVGACCDRKCKTTSQYLCPTQLGGGCCSYGAACALAAGASQGECRVTQTAQPSDLVSQIPEGCTTSQISCAASLGGGCCAVGRACTLVSSTAFCVPATAVITDPSISAVPQNPDAGLSTAAKAGIAVGVIVAAAVVIGAATFLCLRRRRSGRTRYSSVSQSAVGEVGRHGSIPIPVIVGGSELDSGAAPGPISGSASDIRGPTTDYFGPDAVVGPYTDTGADTRDTTPGYERGVPAAPQGPSDIVAPVELGPSGGRSSRGNSIASPTASEHPSQLDGRPLALPHQRVPEDIDGRYELYGCEVSPPLDQASGELHTPSPGGGPRHEPPK